MSRPFLPNYGFYMPAHSMRRGTTIHMLPEHILDLYPCNPTGTDSNEFDYYDRQVRTLTGRNGAAVWLPPSAFFLRPNPVVSNTFERVLSTSFEIVAGNGPWPGRGADHAAGTVICNWTVGATESRSLQIKFPNSAPATTAEPKAVNECPDGECQSSEMFDVDGVSMCWQVDQDEGSVTGLTLYQHTPQTEDSVRDGCLVPIGRFRGIPEDLPFGPSTTVSAGTIVLDLPSPCSTQGMVVVVLAAMTTLYHIRHELHQADLSSRRSGRVFFPLVIGEEDRGLDGIDIPPGAVRSPLYHIVDRSSGWDSQVGESASPPPYDGHEPVGNFGYTFPPPYTHTDPARR